MKGVELVQEMNRIAEGGFHQPMSDGAGELARGLSVKTYGVELKAKPGVSGPGFEPGA